MDKTKKPEMYQVKVNNIGVKPSGSIVMTVLDKSADTFQDMYPDTVEQLKKGELWG